MLAGWSGSACRIAVGLTRGRRGERAAHVGRIGLTQAAGLLDRCRGATQVGRVVLPTLGLYWLEITVPSFASIPDAATPIAAPPAAPTARVAVSRPAAIRFRRKSLASLPTGSEGSARVPSTSSSSASTRTVTAAELSWPSVSASSGIRIRTVFPESASCLTQVSSFEVRATCWVSSPAILIAIDVSLIARYSSVPALLRAVCTRGDVLSRLGFRRQDAERMGDGAVSIRRPMACHSRIAALPLSLHGRQIPERDAVLDAERAASEVLNRVGGDGQIPLSFPAESFWLVQQGRVHPDAIGTLFRFLH